MSLKANYHLAFSSEWVIRLGDGTEESKGKRQDALNQLMPYMNELFVSADYEKRCAEQGISPNLADVRNAAFQKFTEVIQEAKLTLPEKYFAQKGGKTGHHSEYMGFLLAELQYMQRAYPGVEW